MRILLLRALAALAVCVGAAGRAAAQTPPAAQPPLPGDVAISGSIRARAYSWDWFGANAGGDYTYPASLLRVSLSQSRQTHDWQAEFALPLVLDLPSTAVIAAPQGQLGLGASYFAANSNTTHAAALFLKQGFFRWRAIGGVAGQTLKIGRMEFNDGAEVMPKDATLAALKRDRVAQRLLGTFGFSDVGRSIDGGVYSLTFRNFNLTALAGRPTQGVFQVNGWPELKVNVFYGALTRQVGSAARAGEWRAFALAYDDYRDGVVKTDNRAAAARAADAGSIALGTYGAHYLQAVPTGGGPVDLLAWGAIQAGRWGLLRHRAAAYAVEAGWQPSAFARVKPWIRGGLDYGSGDGNATDGTHGTFFQLLPTPRIYARLPFFNMMNSRDAFAELLLRPRKNFTVRGDVHALSLADAHDVWYSGGGAFQTHTFGYTGRASNGHTAVARLYDVSGDYAMTPHIAVGAYYGIGAGGRVARTIYPDGSAVHLGYAELLLKF